MTPKKTPTLSNAIFFQIASATVFVLFTSAVISFYFIDKNIRESFRQRYESLQRLFSDNITNDLLTGAHPDLYRKCLILFNAPIVNRVQVETATGNQICNMTRSSVEPQFVSVQDSIYFDEEKTEAAGRVVVEFNETFFLVLRRQLGTIVAASAFSLIVLLLFLVRRASRRIAKPITLLSSRLKEGDLNVLENVQEPSDRISVQEIKTLFDETRALARRLNVSQRALLDQREQEVQGKIARQVGHDIRSPLAALEMLVNSSNGLPHEVQFLARVTINRVRQIANNLLVPGSTAASSRPEVGATTRSLCCLLEELVSEKRMEFGNRPHITINTDYADSSYGFFSKIIAPDMKRVLSNLINNSAEAMAHGGTITIRLHAPTSESIVIQVADSGGGIPSDILGLIGREGVTFGKQQGLGLGLFHAKKTVESWGGKFEIESTENKGTTVHLKLPRASTPDWFLSQLSLHSGTDIVVLDDDPSIHEVWSHKLSSHGLTNRMKVFNAAAQFSDWFQSKRKEAFKDTVFLFDYELTDQHVTGLDLIDRYGIAKNSYLVSGHFENDLVLKQCQRMGVKMVPKSSIMMLPVLSERKCS